MELHRQGALAAAEAGCERLLAAAPDDAGILHLAGLIAAQTGRLERAIEFLERADALDTRDPFIPFNLGQMQSDASRFEDAAASFARAARLRPGDAEALYRRGNALRMVHRAEEALASFDAAMAYRPLHPETLCARAGALQDLGRLDEALRAYEALTARYPDYPQANYQKGLVLLQLGRWEGAWKLTEWRRRLRSKPHGERALPMPFWSGAEPVAGRTLLVYFEQGLGDTLQMVRFVALAVDAGARVTLVVQPELLPLLADLSPGVRVVTDADLPVAADFHVSLMSLPAAFDTTLATLPARVPYLRADARRVAAWRQRFAGERRLKVGLVWAGGHRPGQPVASAVNLRRNLPLAALAVLDHPGVAFYSLQKGAAAEAELAAAVAAGGTRPALTDLAPELVDFGATAAVVENLDLVISVDTSTAHLAGALGRPVWMLNRFDSCWRWLRGREDSPWYPTLRVYWQERPGEWAEPLARVAAALAQLAARHGADGAR
jgi:Flp pilus assembly protein TadD